MDERLNHTLNRIGETYKFQTQEGSRHYLEVSIGEQAGQLGYADLEDRFKNTHAIVLLKSPQKGMKVRIDGRTFVNYREFATGIAVPGTVVQAEGQRFKPFIPRDSMICNFA